MDTGDRTLSMTIIGIGIGNIGILIALFVFVWQTTDSLRSEIRDTSSELRSEISDAKSELRSEISDAKSELRIEISDAKSEVREIGNRVSEVELEQARIEGANRILSEVLKQQSHTHEAGLN